MNKLLNLLLSLILLSPIFANAQGCMGGDSEEGVTVVGFIQPQFEFLQHEVSDNEITFSFERARFGFVGNIPYDFSYYIMIETSAFKKNDPYLLDASITYSRFGPFLKFAFGQFKSPFSLELNTPCHKLHTIKRSKIVSNLAVPDRDLGFMIFGGNDTTLLSYKLAITNGTGMGQKDGDTYKDLIGRFVISPMQYFSPDSYLDVKIGSSFKFAKALSSVSDTLPDDVTKRYAIDLQVKYDKFLLQGEYIFSKDDGSYTTGGGCGAPLVTHVGSVERNGYFVQAMYRTRWNIEPVLKYEFYEPNIDETFDTESAITFGINIFPNDWTRLQLNYLYNAEEDEIINDKFYLQLQIEF